MTVTLTEQDLVNIKLTVLTLERQEIARNIDPRRFFGHLRAKYIFDERDCDEIRAVPSRIGSAEAFVDVLKRKGAQGYDEFCSGLMKDRTQLFLLQRMTKTLEQLRAKVLDKKKENLLLKLSPQGMGGAPPHPHYQYHSHTLPPGGFPPRHFPQHPTFDSAPLRHIVYNQGPPQPLQMQGGNGHRPLRKVNSRTSNTAEYIPDNAQYYYNGSISPTIPELYSTPKFSSSLPEHNHLIPEGGESMMAFTPPPPSSYPPPHLMGEMWSDGPLPPIGLPGPHPPFQQMTGILSRGGGEEEDHDSPVGYDKATA